MMLRFFQLMRKAADRPAPSEQASSRDVPLLAAPGFGREAVERIRSASLLLVGVGGLGCAAAPYLVAAGVRTVYLCDFDSVREGNLGRQVLYQEADVRQRKVVVAAERLRRHHTSVRVLPLAVKADAAFLARRVPEVDLVLDATDNFGARLAINEACLAHGKPWIMGAVVRSEGQLMVLRGDDFAAPCYRCAYGDAPEALEDCAGGGIVGPVAGIVGSAMAMAALQVLAGQATRPELHLIDAAHWQWRTLRVERQAACPACAGRTARGDAA